VACSWPYLRGCHQVSPTRVLPSTLVSDIAQAFLSSEWTAYISSLNIRHITSSPYSPWMNGSAERANRSLKDCMYRLSGPVEDRLQNALALLRFTPGADGLSPARRLFRRQPLLPIGRLNPKNCPQYELTSEAPYSTGDPVWFRILPPPRRGNKWESGIICDSRSRIIRRAVRHVRKRLPLQAENSVFQTPTPQLPATLRPPESYRRVPSVDALSESDCTSSGSSGSDQEEEMESGLPHIPPGERPPRIPSDVYATWSKAKKNRWAKRCRDAHKRADEFQSAVPEPMTDSSEAPGNPQPISSPEEPITLSEPLQPVEVEPEPVNLASSVFAHGEGPSRERRPPRRMDEYVLSLAPPCTPPPRGPPAYLGRIGLPYQNSLARSIPRW